MNPPPTSNSSHPRILTYPPKPSSVAVARADVMSWLDSLGGFSDDGRDRIALVVSELVTNAVEASPTDHDNVHVALAWHDDEALRLTVTNLNSGPAVPDTSRWKPAEPWAERGRGLGIVAALADRVAVATVNDEVSITAEFATADDRSLSDQSDLNADPEA